MSDPFSAFEKILCRSNAHQNLFLKGVSPEEIDKQIDVFLKALSLLEQGRFLDVEFAIRDAGLSRVWSNPILSILSGRKGMGLHLQGNKQIDWAMDASARFAEAFVELYDAEVTLLERNEVDENLVHLLQHIYVMQQYAIHQQKLLQPQINEEFRDQFQPTGLEKWNTMKFGEMHNYTGIDPVILRICPPHHVFDSYIYDGFVYTTAKDGKLERTPEKEAKGITLAPEFKTLASQKPKKN